MLKKRIIEEKAKSVHNPILTKVVSTPKPEHTRKNVEKLAREVNDKEPITPCPLCEKNKPLQELFDNDKKICDHSMCEKCIRKIIDTDTTEAHPRCPYCREGFSQFGSPKKNVSDYHDSESTLIDNNPYAKGSMMYSFLQKKGGKTRRRRLRRRRTNKRK